MGAWILWGIYRPRSADATVADVEAVGETEIPAAEPLADPATEAEPMPELPSEEIPDPPAPVTGMPPVETPAEAPAEIHATPVDPQPVTETPVVPEEEDVPEEPLAADELRDPAEKEDVPEPDVYQPEVERVIWPALQLSGILGVGASGKGSAILNGEVIGVGEIIMGAELIEVTRQGVRLRKGGEERFMRVGGMLE